MMMQFPESNRLSGAQSRINRVIICLYLSESYLGLILCLLLGFLVLGNNNLVECFSLTRSLEKVVQSVSWIRFICILDVISMLFLPLVFIIYLQLNEKQKYI